MGVYHLMGLGLSPGVVTTPISYLAQRYVRYNEADRAFFGESGEENQRQAGERVGNVQAIVLFTTQEVLSGKIPSQKYAINSPGRNVQNPALQDGEPMRQALPRLLKKVWEPMARRHAADVLARMGKQVQPSLDLYWCTVDRFDIKSTFQRVAQVTVALREHELWANLTGGTNVLNFALELTASLSAEISRLYYVQGQDDNALKCIYHTAEANYWIELPSMPLNLSRVIRAVLHVLGEQSSPVGDTELFSRLIGDPRFGTLFTTISVERFKEEYLRPMWKQNLIRAENHRYTQGARWLNDLKPFDDLLEEARIEDRSVRSLIQDGVIIEDEVRL